MSTRYDKPLLLAAALWLASFQASSATVSLSFDSLPSAQGWQFQAAAGINEAAVFSVSGGTLYQNTMGIGDAGAWYTLPDVIDTTKSFSIDLRARVLASEVVVCCGGGGFGAFADGNQLLAGMQLSQDYVTSYKYNPSNPGSYVISKTAYDTTAFHDYHLAVEADKTFRLFIDQQLIDSGTVSFRSDANLLYLGDLTGNENAKAEITRFVFQQPAAGLVPIPAAAWLFSSALAGLCLLGRSRHPRS